MKALDVGTKAGDFPHLPPGREPGAQSLRTVARRNFLWPFVGFVGTAMFAGGVFVAAGGRGARFDPREEFWGGLVFAAFGLFFIFAALVMREAGRPKRHPRLRGTTLSVAGDGLRLGDEISVTFTGRVRGDRVEVGIACDERVDTELRTTSRARRP